MTFPISRDSGVPKEEGRKRKVIERSCEHEGFRKGGSSAQPGMAVLHGDGVVGVAGDVPAGFLIGVGEQGAGAGDVFFGMDFVELVFGFVAFFGNREHANPMDGGTGSAERGSREAEVVPGQVHGIDDEEEERKRGDSAGDETNRGRGLRLRGHSDFCGRYFALGRARKEAGNAGKGSDAWVVRPKERTERDSKRIPL